jgi:hypothetical protein
MLETSRGAREMSELSVGDGFKFGCGFMLAMLIAWIAMAIIGGILTAIFGGTLAALLERFVSVLPTITNLI